MGKEKCEEKKAKPETKSTKASTSSSHSTSDSRTNTTTGSKATVTSGKASQVSVTTSTANTSLKQPTAGAIPTTVVSSASGAPRTRLASTVEPIQTGLDGSRSLMDDGGFHFRQSVHMVRDLFPEWSSEQVFAKATADNTNYIASGTGLPGNTNADAYGTGLPGNTNAEAYGTGLPGNTNAEAYGTGLPGNTNAEAYGTGLPGNTNAEAYGTGLPGNTNAEVARTEYTTATSGRIRRKASATATASSIHQTASPSRGARKRMSDDILDTALHHPAKRNKKATVAALLAQILDSDEEEDVSWERPVSVTASSIAGPQSSRFGSPPHLRSVDDFDEYEEEDTYSTPYYT